MIRAERGVFLSCFPIIIFVSLFIVGIAPNMLDNRNRYFSFSNLILRKRDFKSDIFNSAQFVICIILASLGFHFAGGDISIQAFNWNNRYFLMLFFLNFELCNLILVYTDSLMGSKISGKDLLFNLKWEIVIYLFILIITTLIISIMKIWALPWSLFMLVLGWIFVNFVSKGTENNIILGSLHSLIEINQSMSIISEPFTSHIQICKMP